MSLQICNPDAYKSYTPAVPANTARTSSEPASSDSHPTS